MKPRRMYSIVLVIAMAGAGAMAQSTKEVPNHQQRRTDSPMARPAAQSHHEVRSCDWIMSRSIANPSGEGIAEIEDLLVDRGSGQIEYALVETGAVLGMGGKVVAVPFSQIRWNSTEEKYTMSSSKDDLGRMPRWSENDWDNLSRPGKPTEVSKHPPGSFGEYYESEQNPYRSTLSDPHEKGLDWSNPTRIEGRIERIDRMPISGYGEHVIVTVRTASGESKKVALGPSWYLSGAGRAPQRSDQVVIQALPVPAGAGAGASGADLVGTSMQLNNEEFVLRSQQSPSWNERHFERNNRTYDQPYYRHVRLSKINGAKINCRGASCGQVDDVIISMSPARIAYLSIDPDTNFLGIGDTKRLVPWSVVTVGLDKTLRIDADKSMLQRSRETPDDVNTLKEADDSISGPFDSQQHDDVRDRRDGDNRTMPSGNR